MDETQTALFAPEAQPAGAAGDSQHAKASGETDRPPAPEAEVRPGYQFVKRVGWIPDDWEAVELGRLASANVDYRGKTPPKSDEGIPVLTAANVKHGEVRFDSIYYIDPIVFDTWTTRGLPQEGDLLVTTEAPVGEVALLPGDRQYLIARRVIAIRFDAGTVDRRFVRYSLLRDRLRELLLAYTQGSTVDRILKPDLFRLPIPTPPLPEQREIARVLGAWDRALADLDALLAASRQRQKGLAQRLLTGEKRLPVYASGDAVQASRIGNLPGDWSYVHIAEVAKEVKRRNASGENIPVLSCTKYEGLVDSLSYFGKQVFGDDTSKYRVVARGEFAYATNHIEEGSIGYQDIHPRGLVSPIYTVFKTNERVDDGYLLRLVKSETYRQLFEAWTNSSVDRRGSLRWKDFSLIRIPLPTVEEQRQITAVLDAADAEIATLEAEREALARQKRGLMQRLLTGEVRVSPEATTVKQA